MTVRTVTAADTSFLVREQGSGDGTAVLLLHGVPETSSVWSRLLPALADGRRVLAPDLPGLGGSSYSGPYDVPSLVAQLAALVEAETGGRAVDVVGHDWGGSLALGLAGARPDLVRRLVVANAPYRHVPLHRALHIPFFALPAAPEALFRLGGRRVVRAMLALGWRASAPIDGESLAEYEAAYTRRSSTAAMLGYYRAATRPRVAAALRRRGGGGQPRVRAERMLVLWGAKDPVLPVSTGETVVKDLGPECVMVTVPDAGHFVVEEAPQVVEEVLLDFLAEAGAGERHLAPPEGPAHHRVPDVEPASGDLGDVPSVGPVPVGATPAEQAAAEPTTPAMKAAAQAPEEKAPATKAPVTKAPATKAAGKKAAAKTPATKAATKKAATKKAATKKPAARPGTAAPPEAPPFSQR